MGQEKITGRQAIAMVALFVTGSSLILGISKNADQDSWMGFLVGFLAFLPMLYLYSRLMGHFPGKGFFDICIEVFGPVIGRIAIGLMAWYALHLGALVMRDFSEFIKVTTFDQMPQLISLICLAWLVIWATRGGVEVLGRSSSVMLPVLIVIVAGTVVFLMKEMHVENLLPVGENLDGVPKDALTDFAYPLAETVLFLAILGALKDNQKPGKPMLAGVAIGGAIVLFGGFIRNVLVMGFPLVSDINFTSFNVVSIAIVGGFLARIEALVTANLLMAGFVKISVCLLAASKGFARILNTADHRPFAAPLGLLMVALASIAYDYTMDMFAFLDVYKYYALVFQVFIPVALAIVAEVRMFVMERKMKKKA